jgi:hypothetical protein
VIRYLRMPKLDQKEILAALVKAAPPPNNEKEIDELVERVQEARKTADESISRLYEVSNELREKVRRASTAGAHSHMIFANAYIRLAAAFAQGLKRLVSTDRILVRAKSEQDEAAREERQEQAQNAARKAKKQTEKLVQPSESAFDELYGEVISHAE